MKIQDRDLLTIDKQEKRKRICQFMEENSLDALIINRQDNFSWFTSGGDNHVLSSSEQGAACIVITGDAKYLCAYPMDGYRIMDEEINSNDIELKITNWYEDSPLELAKKITRGKRTASDIELPGVEFILNKLVGLHYPLTELEIERCRWIGKKSNEILAQIAKDIKPGQTEYQIGAKILEEYYKEGMRIDVLIIGSDQRILKYRHPMPTDKKINEYVLLHPAVKKWGLHANVSRLVHFGLPPKEIKNKYLAACSVQASIIDSLEPGMLFKDIFKFIKNQYIKYGYPEEWKKHFQGAITGYIAADSSISLNNTLVAQKNQTYDWFITITGVKSEELSFLGAKNAQFLSVTNSWPNFNVCLNNKEIEMPEIMIL